MEVGDGQVRSRYRLIDFRDLNLYPAIRAALPDRAAMPLRSALKKRIQIGISYLLIVVSFWILGHFFVFSFIAPVPFQQDRIVETGLTFGSILVGCGKESIMFRNNGGFEDSGIIFKRKGNKNSTEVNPFLQYQLPFHATLKGEFHMIQKPSRFQVTIPFWMLFSISLVIIFIYVGGAKSEPNKPEISSLIKSRFD